MVFAIDKMICYACALSIMFTYLLLLLLLMRKSARRQRCERRGECAQRERREAREMLMIFRAIVDAPDAHDAADIDAMFV